MAGRGTDIILGGNSEFMARLKLREILLPRIVSPQDDPNVVRTENSAYVSINVTSHYSLFINIFLLETSIIDSRRCSGLNYVL